MTRPGGSLAVLIGAIIGVTAALARRGEEVSPAPESRPRPEVMQPAEPETPATSPAAEPLAAELARASHAPAALGVVPHASASAGVRRLPAPTPIASPAELKATEVRCYDQDPLACRRAAEAYASGNLVPKDLERASTYRKVELTQLVRLCEKNKPRACLGLADLYDAGDGIAKDARRAEQLSEHARGLCRRRPSDECRSLALP